MHHINLEEKGFKHSKDTSSPSYAMWMTRSHTTCGTGSPHKRRCKGNLMWQENVTPKLYAYEYLKGLHNSDNIPLSPLWCAVQIHKNDDCRALWSPYSVSGWYLETSTDHYQYYNVWIK